VASAVSILTYEDSGLSVEDDAILGLFADRQSIYESAEIGSDREGGNDQGRHVSLAD
jgi:hypothetical protein